MKKHKYLASFPSDRWARLARDAERRGVSYNVVINDALDDSHMKNLYGLGLFEDSFLWHDAKKEAPDHNKLLILATFGRIIDYSIATYNEVTKKYYYIDSAHSPNPDYWMYLPELKI